MAQREMGHKLLARLGKTKLRPGGIEGTGWLINQAEQSGKLALGSKVLEVACNRGFTLIDLARRYDIQAEGIDSDPDVIAQAEKNVFDASLSDHIHVQVGDATALPFEDGTFDVVINEAMLTMLSDTAKTKAVSEYHRVLKPGGILLTHDVMLIKKNPLMIKMLQKVINVPAHPLTQEGWKSVFTNNGFAAVSTKTGAFTLLTDEGLARDEGEQGREHLLENALNDDNFSQFSEMRTFFDIAKNDIGYITVASVK